MTHPSDTVEHDVATALALPTLEDVAAALRDLGIPATSSASGLHVGTGEVYMFRAGEGVGQRWFVCAYLREPLECLVEMVHQLRGEP